MEFSKNKQVNRKPKKECIVIGCSNKATKGKFCGIHNINKKKPTPSKSNLSKRASSDYSKWKKKLDSVFSLFIRLRDTDKNGFGRCISSGRLIYYIIDENGEIKSNCDNGHFENRAIMSLRFSELNCNAQSRFDNQFREGEKDNYEKGIIKKYGEEGLKEIKKTKMTSKKYTTIDFIALYAHYEQQVAFLLSTKEWWTGQRKQKSLYK